MAHPDTPPLVIEIRGLTKRYGDTLAVDGLDLAIPRGVFYGLVGPNGAGKTTTVGLITGTVRPTDGEIRLFGSKHDPDDPRTRARLGVLPEDPPLYERLTGAEQLVFTGRMFGLDPGEARRRAEELLSLLQLERDGQTLIADYSRGMRRKLAMGCALTHSAQLLVFDEPFEGVDAVSSETIRQVLAGLTRQGATVLCTTHILEMAETVCERVGILHRGRLAWESDMASLAREGATLRQVFHQTVGTSAEPAILPDWLRNEDAGD